MLWQRKAKRKRLPQLNKRSSQGFTLVELLLAIALLALVTAIALPAVNVFGNKRNLEIAARVMATDLRKAQQKAITFGWTQLIEFRPTTKQYRIKDGKTEEIVIVELPEGIDYAVNTYDHFNDFPLLRFRPTGAPCQGGTIGLENSSKDILYLIITPATGRIRISEDPPEHWEIY
ncbi:MAG: prepilin-type N-terminal cleavage/methylation domain-containing protein [Bacillota bacterium]